MHDCPKCQNLKIFPNRATLVTSLREYREKQGEEVVTSSRNHLLQVVESGSFELQLFYDKNAPVQLNCYPGTYFYTPPYFPEFRILWKSSSKQSIKVITLSFDELDVASQREKLPNIQLQLIDARYDSLIFTSIKQLLVLKQAKKEQIFYNLLVNTLLFQLYESNTNTDCFTKDEHTTALSLYIAQNLDRKISIDELAHLFGVSKFHFIRRFKINYGLPPHQYIKKLKLQKAQTLLSRTDKTISEIAYEIGYSTPSRFSKDFRSFAQCSPSKFRARRKQ
jgi:AraC-like DNA-binding protein